MTSLRELLEASAALHRHLCPRQVLGVRMGLLGGGMLDLDVPQSHNNKGRLTIAETDGSAVNQVLANSQRPVLICR